MKKYILISSISGMVLDDQVFQWPVKKVNPHIMYVELKPRNADDPKPWTSQKTGEVIRFVVSGTLPDWHSPHSPQVLQEQSGTWQTRIPDNADS